MNAKLYKKIDIYIDGEYYRSTMQAKNLKIAKERFLSMYPEYKERKIQVVYGRLD